MDNAIMLIVLIVLIVALIAVLTSAKQQEAVEEGFTNWERIDRAARQFTASEYHPNIPYPDYGNNKASNLYRSTRAKQKANRMRYCNLMANLDGCRWNNQHRTDPMCARACVAGKTMAKSCSLGSYWWNNDKKCSHRGMTKRREIDKCKKGLFNGQWREACTNDYMPRR